MKHLLTLATSLALTVSLAQAQSNEKNAQTAPKATTAKESAAPAQVQRVDSADKLQTATPARTHKVRMEDIDRGIADIERIMKENEGKADFQKEAYEKRLDHLHKIKAEQQTTTPKSDQ